MAPQPQTLVAQPVVATLALLLLSHAPGASAGCSGSAPLLDLELEAAGYAADHLNYICTNWTRPTPLPCKPAVDSWKPRWTAGATVRP